MVDDVPLTLRQPFGVLVGSDAVVRSDRDDYSNEGTTTWQLVVVDYVAVGGAVVVDDDRRVRIQVVEYHSP